MSMHTMGPWAKTTVPFPEEEYQGRLKRLTKEIERRKLDALLVTSAKNRFYLTGFAASNGWLLVRPGAKAVFYTDFRYLEAAQSQLGFCSVKTIGKAATVLGPISEKQRWRKVGYEASWTVGQWQQFKEALPKVKEWVAASDAVARLRMVKSELELNVIRASVAANDEALALFCGEIRPGLSEWEMRRIIRGHVDDLSQGESFDCIVCAGANASHCHHVPGHRKLGRNDILLVDMGLLVQSYCSDMTRTMHTGKASPRFRKIYEITLDANRKAIEAVKPGLRCRDIDKVARDIIEQAGYGEYFGHGLGHGVGLDIHEPPAFGKTDETVLEPGMVMTVEPGVYLPGFGGVRIEDMIVVTERGCHVLTRSPKELKRVG